MEFRISLFKEPYEVLADASTGGDKDDLAELLDMQLDGGDAFHLQKAGKLFKFTYDFQTSGKDLPKLTEPANRQRRP